MISIFFAIIEQPSLNTNKIQNTIILIREVITVLLIRHKRLWNHERIFYHDVKLWKSVGSGNNKFKFKQFMLMNFLIKLK